MKETVSDEARVDQWGVRYYDVILPSRTLAPYISQYDYTSSYDSR